VKVEYGDEPRPSGLSPTPWWRDPRIAPRLGYASLLAATLSLAAPGLALAQGYVLTPTVELQGGYDDNFRLAEEGEPEDEVGTGRIAGELALSRIAETVEIVGLLGVDAATYWGDDEGLEDDSNQLLDFTVLNKRELTNLGIEASLRRDSLRRSVETADDPGEVPIDPDDDVDDDFVDERVAETVRRDQIIVGPFLERQLTELMSVNLGYQFQDTSYEELEGIVDPANRVTDFRYHTVTAGLSRQVTERDDLVLLTGGSFYRADNDREFDTYELQVGVDHAFSETASGVFTVGARQTSFDIPGVEEDDDTGIVARIAGSKLAGLTRFSGILERTVSPSASGDQVQTDRLVFNITRKLTERLGFTLRSKLYENESLRDLASPSNRRYLTFEPSLSYLLTESFALEGAYEYGRQKRFGEAESGDSNAVFLSLIYSTDLPFLEE
jgi:hypothetical protein